MSGDKPYDYSREIDNALRKPPFYSRNEDDYYVERDFRGRLIEVNGNRDEEEEDD